MGAVTISTLADIFADISYVCGMIFCKYKEFEQTVEYQGRTESSAEFIKQFEEFIWNFIHNAKVASK